MFQSINVSDFSDQTKINNTNKHHLFFIISIIPFHFIVFQRTNSTCKQTRGMCQSCN